MATLDEILGGSTDDNDEKHAQKSTQEWVENNSGENASVSRATTTASAAGTNPVKTDAATSSDGVGRHEELFKKLNTYTPPTEEELKKEKKKQKRNQIFNAIGDGIAALSNLYFATQGAPSMYDGKNTLSEAGRVRYDKLLKDREEKKNAYFNGMMKARQADQAEANAERSWQRMLEREQIADERYTNEQKYKRGRDKENDRRWQANFDEDKRRADRNYNFNVRQHNDNVRQHNDNVAVRREAAAATRARGVRGKQLGFADGSGNQVAIYENVWKGSMQQVYDAMLQDLAPADEAERKRWERQMKKLDTPQKKEDYVKQNWYKSDKAKAQMLALSKLDPATMTSELSDDVEDYTPGGGGNDEIIDYVPGNNK